MAEQEDLLTRLAMVLRARRDADPAHSYVAALYAQGAPAILAKIAEESAEVVEAGAGEDDAHLVHELADLWFHTLVLIEHRRLLPADVLAELGRRFGVSGKAEKAARAQSAAPSHHSQS